MTAVSIYSVEGLSGLGGRLLLGLLADRLGAKRVLVGGLLVQALGRIPRSGERFQLRGLEFDVLAATATRVERIAVRRGPVRAVTLDGSEDLP
jgi:CBS domain containing-hemolysin-like protein